MCYETYKFECDLETCEFRAAVGDVACESCMENGDCKLCTKQGECILKLHCLTNKCRIKATDTSILSYSEALDEAFPTDDLLPNYNDISG